MKQFLLPVGLLTGLLSSGWQPAAAQAPGWQSARTVAVATAAAATNNSVVTATAVDAAGNVYLAGSFTNSVVLGGTTLVSLGDADVFVAKFNPAGNQLVWAQRAGGTGDDVANALAVNGNSVYVAGRFNSPTAGFGPITLLTAGSNDVFVAKLTDAGSTGSFTWAQRAGGTGYDIATALAVSGTSVYVTGYFNSPMAGFGPTTSLAAVAGNSDVFVAKLTDAGSTGSFAWAQRAGGADDDRATALAVSGTSVYVAGRFDGSASGFGATTLAAMGSGFDVFVTKLTDAGSTGSFTWAQRAGGTRSDGATALGVSGASVYVAGYFDSFTAGFGATTLAMTGIYDVFVAKLTDAGSTGSFVWAQRAGGTGYDAATALVVSGSNVYIVGYFNSASASFGPTTLTTIGAFDVFVAKLTDAGSTGNFVWAQQAGGPGNDQASTLAMSGPSAYVAGHFESASAGFSPLTITNPFPGPNIPVGFLASLNDPTLTATTIGRALAPASLFPNPARGTATLRLPADTIPAPLTLTDALGRAVRRYPAPAGSEATLDLRGLPAGLYLLRGAGPATRLAVE